MARKKEFYLRDAKDNFTAGLNMLNVDEGLPEIQALRNAARQAQEAAANLWMLAGILESQTESGNRAPVKQQESEITRMSGKKT
jgi:hypothetical protein